MTHYLDSLKRSFRGKANEVIAARDERVENLKQNIPRLSCRSASQES
ncbi:MAG: hypothetical protein R2744_07160 [Bacteroidales bacterium]